MRKLKKRPVKKASAIKRWFAVLLILSAGSAVVWMTPAAREAILSLKANMEHVMALNEFKLAQVTVDGHARTPLAAVNERLNLSQGMNIFDVDLSLIREELLSLPWIAEAIVERRLPDTIYIRVCEKTPIALWQNKRRYQPLDETGHPIADETMVFNQLMLVVGVDAPSQTPGLIQALEKYPVIYDKVRSAVRVGNRRWNLILNDPEDGLVVYLPDTDIEAALERLEQLNEEENLLEKDLKIIDLRLKDRLIIRTNAQELANRARQKGEK